MRQPCNVKVNNSVLVALAQIYWDRRDSEALIEMWRFGAWHDGTTCLACWRKAKNMLRAQLCVYRIETSEIILSGTGKAPV